MTPLYVSEQAKGPGKFTPHPEGVMPGILVDIHDVGWIENKTWDKKEHKADFYYFCGKYKEDGDKKFPLLVRERFTLSLGEKARLRKHLESWRGKLTQDELKKLDLESLLGQPALLQITHNESGDNVYANITSIMALPEGMVAPTPPEGFVRMQDREPKEERSPIQQEVDDQDSDLPF